MSHPVIPGAPSNARRAVRRRRQWLAQKGEELFFWLPGADLPTIGGEFTRTTGGTYYDRAIGVGQQRIVRSAAVDEFRDSHYEIYPALSTEIAIYRTGLLEPARTNEATFSEDYTNAVWNKDGVTVTPNESEAPDGVAASMDKLVESSNFEDHFIDRGYTIVAGDPAAFSAFVKESGRFLVKAEIIGNPTSANFIRIVIDLRDGTGTLSTGGAGVIESAFVDRDINGSLRVSIAGSVGGTDTAVIGRLSLLNDSAVTPYTGDGVSGINVWGSQTELGAVEGIYSSSYQPALGAGSAFRDFDHFAFVWPETLPPESMALFFRYTERGANLEANQTRLFHLGQSGNRNTNPKLFARKTGSNAVPRAEHFDEVGDTSNIRPLDRSAVILDIVDYILRLFNDGHLAGEGVINGLEFSQAEDLINTPGLGSNWGGDPSSLTLGDIGDGTDAGAISLHGFIVTTNREAVFQPLQPPALDDLGFRIDEGENPDLAFLELTFDDVVASDVDADPGFVSFNEDPTNEEEITQEGNLVFFGTPGAAFFSDAFQGGAFS